MQNPLVRNTKDVRRERRKYKKTNINEIQDIPNTPQFSQVNNHPTQIPQTFTPNRSAYQSPRQINLNRPQINQVRTSLQGLKFHTGPSATYNPIYMSKSQSLSNSRTERISAPAQIGNDQSAFKIQQSLNSPPQIKVIPSNEKKIENFNTDEKNIPKPVVKNPLMKPIENLKKIEIQGKKLLKKNWKKVNLRLLRILSTLLVMLDLIVWIK